MGKDIALTRGWLVKDLPPGMRSLCGMVAYKVLKSKNVTDLTYLLILILFSLVTIRKEFCTIQNSLQPE